MVMPKLGGVRLQADSAIWEVGEQWVMNVELLPLAALACDRYGQKRIFLAGIASTAWARP